MSASSGSSWSSKAAPPDLATELAFERHRVSTLQTQVDRLQAEVNGLTEALTVLDEELDKANSESAALRKKCRAAETVPMLEAQVKAERAQNQTLESCLATTRQRAEAMQATAQAAIQEVQDRWDEFQAKYADLEAAHESTLDDLNSLRANATSTEILFNRQAATIADLKETITKEREWSLECEEALSEANAHLDHRTAEVNDVQDQLRKTSDQLSEYQMLTTRQDQSLFRTQKELAAAKQDVKSAERAAKVWEARATEAKSELRGMAISAADSRADLEAVTKQLAATEEDLTAATNQVTLFRRLVKKRDGQVADLTKDLEGVGTRFKTAETGLTARVAALTSKIASLEEQLAQTTVRNDELEYELEVSDAAWAAKDELEIHLKQVRSDTGTDRISGDEWRLFDAFCTRYSDDIGVIAQSYGAWSVQHIDGNEAVISVHDAFADMAIIVARLMGDLETATQDQEALATLRSWVAPQGGLASVTDTAWQKSLAAFGSRHLASVPASGTSPPAAGEAHFVPDLRSLLYHETPAFAVDDGRSSDAVSETPLGGSATLSEILVVTRRLFQAVHFLTEENTHVRLFAKDHGLEPGTVLPNNPDVSEALSSEQDGNDDNTGDDFELVDAPADLAIADPVDTGDTENAENAEDAEDSATEAEKPAPSRGWSLW